MSEDWLEFMLRRGEELARRLTREDISGSAGAVSGRSDGGPGWDTFPLSMPSSPPFRLLLPAHPSA
jgi:hypothetical protein